MKKYEDMSLVEISRIVNTGGDDLRRLNEMVSDHLDSLPLSPQAHDIVCGTEISAMAEVFGGLFTTEQVERFLMENR